MTQPWLDGFRPGPRSWVLAGCRWLLVLGASLPAAMVAVSGVTSGPARLPYYTEVQGPLPMMHLGRLASDLPQGLGPALAGAVILAVFVSMLLNGAALHVLDPAEGSPPPLGEAVRRAWGLLPTFLRILALELLLIAAGAMALKGLFGWLELVGKRSGWTGYSLVVTLPAARVVLAVTWTATVGAFGLWTRALTVLDGRRRVRRTAWLTMRGWRRSPVSGPILFVMATVGAAIVLGAILVAWRQAPPATVGATVGRLGGWMAILALHAWLWHGLTRGAVLVLSTPALASIRQVGDDSYGILALVRGWTRRPGAQEQRPDEEAS